MRRICFTASRFTTGRVPGCARQTGQTCVFGRASSGSFAESQNILVRVVSSACISRPIVGRYMPQEYPKPLKAPNPKHEIRNKHQNSKFKTIRTYFSSFSAYFLFVSDFVLRASCFSIFESWSANFFSIAGSFIDTRSTSLLASLGQGSAPCVDE